MILLSQRKKRGHAVVLWAASPLPSPHFSPGKKKAPREEGLKGLARVGLVENDGGRHLAEPEEVAVDRLVAEGIAPVEDGDQGVGSGEHLVVVGMLEHAGGGVVACRRIGGQEDDEHGGVAGELLGLDVAHPAQDVAVGLTVDKTVGGIAGRIDSVGGEMGVVGPGGGDDQRRFDRMEDRVVALVIAPRSVVHVAPYASVDGGGGVVGREGADSVADMDFVGNGVGVGIGGRIDRVVPVTRDGDRENEQREGWQQCVFHNVVCLKFRCKDTKKSEL